MASFVRGSNRQWILALVALALLGFFGYRALWPSNDTPVLPAKAATRSTSAPSVPRIDLARLDRKPSSSSESKRDIFLFGVSEDQSGGGTGPGGANAAAATPEPLPTPPPEPTPTPLPVVNLRYGGAYDDGRGVKVAFFFGERGERFQGRVGEVIANRFRVTKIGLESVDLEDVLGGGTRRLPLKGGS